MDKLNAVKKDVPLTMWCGPSVVASLTNQPMSKVIAAFREVMPGVASDEGVRGTTKWQVERVFQKFGYRLEKRDYFDRRELSHTERETISDKTGKFPPMYSSDSRPTLANYASKNRAKFQKYGMLVEVTGHWTSLFGRRGFDNHCPGYKPVPLRQLSFRRARVVGSWSVVPIGEIMQPDPVMPAPPKPPKSPFKKAAQARRRLANEIAAPIDFTEHLRSVDKAIAASERRLKDLL